MPQEVIELKPCPFCGGEAVIKTNPDIPGLNGYQIGCESKPTQYVCPGCISGSTYYWNKEMAITSWNRRAKPAPHPDPLTPEDELADTIARQKELDV